MARRHIAVLGGGVTGLTAAYKLRCETVPYQSLPPCQTLQRAVHD